MAQASDIPTRTIAYALKQMMPDSTCMAEGWIFQRTMDLDVLGAGWYSGCARSVHRTLTNNRRRDVWEVVRYTGTGFHAV
jgi:hypothetical protein